MNTLRKVSVIVLLPAVIVMVSFFAMSFGVDVGPKFLYKLFMGIVITIAAFGILLLISRAANAGKGRRYEPQPQAKQEDEEIKFHEIKGTRWTRNYVSDADKDGKVIAMFQRRSDNEIRIVDGIAYDTFIVYMVMIDHSWRKVQELDQESLARYLEDWSMGLANV